MNEPKLDQLLYNIRTEALRNFHEISRYTIFDIKNGKRIYTKKEDKLSLEVLHLQTQRNGNGTGDSFGLIISWAKLLKNSLALHVNFCLYLLSVY